MADIRETCKNGEPLFTCPQCFDRRFNVIRDEDTRALLVICSDCCYEVGTLE